MVSKTEIRTITSISVRSEPAITVYRKGDTLRTNGLMLNAEYSDGSNEIVWKDFTCSPTVFEETGPRDIVVSYEGLSTKFHVNVINSYVMENSYHILENFEFANVEENSEDLPLENLGVRCTTAILDDETTSVGYDENGMPVTRCLRFEFDMPEQIQGMPKQMIYCSWNHVRLPGDNEDWMIYDGIEKYTWELKLSGVTYCDTEIIPEEFSPTGKPRLVYKVFLPDVYGLKGEQLVILQVGNMKRAIHFSLDYVYGYPGNYRNGNGWIIDNIRY